VRYLSWVFRPLPPHRSPMWKVLAAFALAIPLWIPGAVAASEVEEAETQLRTGRYAEAIAAAREALTSKSPSEAWHRVLLEGLLTTGQVQEALAAWTNAVAQEGRSVRLRWLGRDVLLANGDTEGAAAQLNSIAQLVGNRAGNYRDIPSLGSSSTASSMSPARRPPMSAR